MRPPESFTAVCIDISALHLLAVFPDPDAGSVVRERESFHLIIGKELLIAGKFMQRFGTAKEENDNVRLARQYIIRVQQVMAYETMAKLRYRIFSQIGIGQAVHVKAW